MVNMNSLEKFEHKKDEIKELLEENKRLTKLVLTNTERIRKYIFWGRVISFIYLIIILAPIVLAVIFLPPFIRSTIAPYQELLGVGSSGKREVTVDIVDNVKQFLDEYQEVTKQQ